MPREKGDKDEVVLKYLGQSNGGVVGGTDGAALARGQV